MFREIAIQEMCAEHSEKRWKVIDLAVPRLKIVKTEEKKKNGEGQNQRFVTIFANMSKDSSYEDVVECAYYNLAIKVEHTHSLDGKLKARCHVPFNYAITTLQCVLEEFTLLNTTKLRYFKTRAHQCKFDWHFSISLFTDH